MNNKLDKSKNLIWIDLEMTGLDVEKDVIIEIATIITDIDLNIIDIGPNIAIFQKDEILDTMDDWNVKHHTQSNLISRVKKSSYDENQAMNETLDFLKKYCDKNSSPMCGNSICQDRRFLHTHMKELENFFHYRNIDVSSFKELYKRWSNKDSFVKKNSHLALDDIKESIEELKFYRKNFISC